MLYFDTSQSSPPPPLKLKVTCCAGCPVAPRTMLGPGLRNAVPLGQGRAGPYCAARATAGPYECAGGKSYTTNFGTKRMPRRRRIGCRLVRSSNQLLLATTASEFGQFHQP
jgi:hypothetical protein